MSSTCTTGPSGVGFKVPGLTPVEVPDLVVPPSKPAKVAAAPAGAHLSNRLRERAFAVKHQAFARRARSKLPGQDSNLEKQDQNLL